MLNNSLKLYKIIYSIALLSIVLHFHKAPRNYSFLFPLIFRALENFRLVYVVKSKRKKIIRNTRGLLTNGIKYLVNFRR